MDIISLLISPEFLFLSLAITAMVYVLRIVVEGVFKTISNNHIWRDIVLPVTPIVLGGLFSALAAQFPCPELMSSLSARIVFGLVAGLLSAQVYKIIKGILNKKTE